MKTRFVAVCICLVLFGAIAPIGAAALTADPPAGASTPLYLALGDSLAVGVGASNPSSTGYVPLLLDYLRGALSCDRGQSQLCPELQLLNLGQAGGTTTSLLQSQLPAALEALAARNGDDNPRNDVEVITVDIGGNDAAVLNEICAGGITPQCVQGVQTTFGTIAQNLTTALAQLRTAAGPDTRIIVMTYFNSLIACDLAALAPLVDVLLEGGSGLNGGLNDLIRGTASVVGASVAETYGLLGPGDLVGGSDCRHPVDSGYRIIADAFTAA